MHLRVHMYIHTCICYEQNAARSGGHIYCCACACVCTVGLQSKVQIGKEFMALFVSNPGMTPSKQHTQVLWYESAT